MAKTLAMQRSLKKLKDEGWQVARVERWQMRPQAKFGLRVDVWGFGDILACRPFSYTQMIGPYVLKEGKVGTIALVQTFPKANWLAHVRKIKALQAADTWKAAGGIIILHGWHFGPKDGVRRAKKVWQCREEIL